MSSLVILDWFMLRAHGLYGGQVEVVLVARLGWVRAEASGGWITSVRLWVLPEFFWWSCDGSDVALMQLGAKWDGWEVACAVSTQSVLGGSDFSSDLSRCFGKDGAMVVEGRHGWGCDGSGGRATATVVVVLGMDRIGGWCGLAWAEHLTLELVLGLFWAVVFYFISNYYLSFSFLFSIIPYNLSVGIGRVYPDLCAQCTWSVLVRGRFVRIIK